MQIERKVGGAHQHKPVTPGTAEMQFGPTDQVPSSTTTSVFLQARPLCIAASITPRAVRLEPIRPVGLAGSMSGRFTAADGWPVFPDTAPLSPTSLCAPSGDGTRQLNPLFVPAVGTRMLKTHRLSRIAVMGARIIVSANPRARQAKENRTIALIIGAIVGLCLLTCLLIAGHAHRPVGA